MCVPAYGDSSQPASLREGGAGKDLAA
jgi:iron complex transport system ATP-binding protein